MELNNNQQFEPDLSPKQMLELGVFGSAYFSEADRREFPSDWFAKAQLSDHGPDPKYNFFEISASQPLSVWQKKGWINPVDPLGWFQWYCRYSLGRRLPIEDERQIKRWRAMKRHVAQIKQSCYPGDLTCRRRQRQALLHWSYDSRRI